MVLGIDPSEWRDHPNVLTDSLWVFDNRDNSGAHSNGLEYWGNFVPQIPRQLMLRFTKPGSLVFDPFAGSGTTLVEARRMGRHAFGVELLANVADKAQAAVDEEPNPYHTVATVVQGDAADDETMRGLVAGTGAGVFDLVVLHPPYHDIIKFSDDGRCLSNSQNEADFLSRLAHVAAKCDVLLAPGGHAALVISDKYAKGEWVPLAFYAMQAVRERTGWTLKANVVKNMGETKAKGKNRNLWRYRAFKSGLYVFAHEHVFLFRKPTAPARPVQASLFDNIFSEVGS